MKHILVATDFSETAAAALRQACKMAALSSGKVTLLHVIFADKINETLLGLDAIEHLANAADQARYDPAQAMTRLRDAARKKLDDAVAALGAPRPAIELVVVEGRPSVEVSKYAAAHGIDLIIVGTHGRGAIGKAFLGSVADNVIRQAECPVMVVRQ